MAPRQAGLLSSDSMRRRRVLAWSVRAFIVSKRVTVKKLGKCRGVSAGKMRRGSGAEGKIVVYRGYFVRLLSVPKPLRDQLLIELPTLEAFRTGEVSSFRAEYCDFESGDLQVLDSKKGELFTVPLDPVVAGHLERYIADRGVSEGYLFLPRRRRKPGNRSVGASLTDWAILNVWKRWCVAAGVPVMSPRLGRAFFAVVWHFVEHKSMYGLMAILRHDDIQSTEHYLSRLIDYPSVKAEFNVGKEPSFSLSLSCLRFASCPLAAEGCRCRMFQPLMSEVKQE